MTFVLITYRMEKYVCSVQGVLDISIWSTHFEESTHWLGSNYNYISKLPLISAC